MTTIVKQDWLKEHHQADAKHAHRVAQSCLKIARRLNLFQEDVDALYQAALIHDLKNISIFGHMIKLGDQADIIKNKDEWYDGSGKEGLMRGGIPVLSRVLAIAEFYDTMVYKYHYSKDYALDELQRLSGIRFDPMLIPVSMRVLEGKQ